MLIIAHENGDYTSVAEALAAYAHCDEPLLLLVRMDTYDDELNITRSHVRIVGEARLRTILQCAHEPVITGTDIVIENLTVRVTQPDGSNCDTVYEEEQEHVPVAYVLCDENLQPDDVALTGCTEWLMQQGGSSKSFVSSQLLGFAELCMHRGDRVLIALGAHDADEDVQHHTDARITFPLYLSMFVDACRRHEAEPVMVLTAAVQEHYAEAMRDAAIQRGVQLISIGREEKGKQKEFNPQQMGGRLYDPLRL